MTKQLVIAVCPMVGSLAASASVGAGGSAARLFVPRPAGFDLNVARTARDARAIEVEGWVRVAGRSGEV